MNVRLREYPELLAINQTKWVTPTFALLCNFHLQATKPREPVLQWAVGTEEHVV